MTQIFPHIGVIGERITSVPDRQFLDEKLFTRVTVEACSYCRKVGRRVDTTVMHHREPGFAGSYPIEKKNQKARAEKLNAL